MAPFYESCHGVPVTEGFIFDLPKSILTVGSSARGLVREKRYKDTYNW